MWGLGIGKLVGFLFIQVGLEGRWFERRFGLIRKDLRGYSMLVWLGLLGRLRRHIPITWAGGLKSHKRRERRLGRDNSCLMTCREAPNR